MTVKAADIEVLTGLEPVRKRPGMYIGPVSTAYGVFNWAREPIDNAIDEWVSGRSDRLLVEVEDNVLTVADTGSGIPVEKHPKVKESTLTVVFTRLHAGAKFGSSKSYRGKTTTGMHGVGVSVTNALALELEVWTHRDGQWYYQKFERGRPVTKVKKAKGPPLKRWPKGTVVRATPDPAVFKKAKLPVKLLEDFLVNLSYLCPGLKITFNGQTFAVKRGAEHLLVDRLLSGQTTLFRPFVHNTKDLQVALTWTASDETEILSFVNFLRTRAHGTHVDGLKDAIVKAVRSLEPKRTKGLTATDLLLGLRAVLHLKLPEPSFDSQTKDRLDSPEGEQVVRDTLQPELMRFFSQRRSALASLIKRACKVRDARSRFKEEVVALKKAAAEVRKADRALPAKLLVSPTARPSERELFIVEGDSAGGTARKARDQRYQEVLPIRGKVPNVLRLTPQKALKNEELLAIAKAIGAGLGDKCDPAKARVARIIFLTDADPDGDHIKLLLLTYVVKYMRPLLDAGMVYVAEAPLYVARKGPKKVYGNTLRELERQLGSLKGALVTRMKGWAEASADDLKEIAFNPSTRRLRKVIVRRPLELVAIDELMGTDTTPRKRLLRLM